MTLVKKYFTSSGSWTAPAGVTNVLVIMAGGGGGGAGGYKGTSFSAGGGGGAWQVASIVEVVPNTSYTITIGAGGTGGGVGNVSTGFPGNNGSDTTFGALLTAKGGGYGICQSNASCGGIPIAGNPYNQATTAGNYWTTVLPGYGGQNFGGSSAIFPYDGGSGHSPNGYSGTTVAAASGSYLGGSAGGAGPQGNGGAGGAGNNGGVATDGTDCPNNTSAGGGGGGCSPTQTGSGGDGGSGYCYVMWDE